MYKFRIDVKENDVDKCREVIIYFTGYCYYTVFKKIKCNTCKNIVSERDNLKEIPEINSYLQGLIEVLSYIIMILLQILFNIIMKSFGKLIKDYSFLHSINQRKLTMHITLNVLADYELLFNIDSWDDYLNLDKNMQIKTMLIMIFLNLKQLK